MEAVKDEAYFEGILSGRIVATRERAKVELQESGILVPGFEEQTFLFAAHEGRYLRHSRLFEVLRSEEDLCAATGTSPVSATTYELRVGTDAEQMENVCATRLRGDSWLQTARNGQLRYRRPVTGTVTGETLCSALRMCRKLLRRMLC